MQPNKIFSHARVFFAALLLLFAASISMAQISPEPNGVVVITASDTLLDPGQNLMPNPVYQIGTLAANATITLPHASTTWGAQHITILNLYNQGSFTITIAAQSGDSVNGATTYTGLTKQYQVITLWCSPQVRGKWYLLDNGYSTAGGDLSGTYPNPTVAKINGTAFTLPVSVANGGTGGTTLTTAQAGLGVQVASISSAVTTTGQTLTNATGLSFAVGANDVWYFQITLNVGSSSAAGDEFGFTVPASGTFLGLANGTTSGITAYSTDIMNTSATAGIAFCTVNAQTGYLTITGTYRGGGTGGTVQLQFLKVTSGTATVLANSNIVAIRIS